MGNGPGNRRWLSWALVASLGLNLAFLGLAAGAIVHGPPDRGGPGERWSHVRALPEPYRHDLDRAMRAERDTWYASREAFREQRAALAAALTAEPFDIAAVEAAMRREHDLGAALFDRGAEMLLVQVARMTPEERVAYAEALLEDRGRNGPRRHRD